VPRRFETVAQAQRRARRVLPSCVYAALLAGAEEGRTLTGNTAAFAELGFAPRAAGLPARRDQAVTVLGQRLALPVILSPVGVQAVHPGGELAAARAAAARGTVACLSQFASQPVQDVAAAGGRTFFQLHWTGPRELLLEQAQRARAAGAAGLIMTLDWTFAHRRDWGSPVIPERLDLAALTRFGPQALARPRWLLRYARSGRLPALTVPNAAAPGAPAPGFFAAYRDWQQASPPSWADLRWLAPRCAGPFMLKGVTRADDARRAVDAGFSAVGVSNHGGNNLDTAPASVRALPAIAAAVGGQADVLLDGGIRRGGDVVKALALGARAVLIGRPYLWGLAVAGQAGVENVLDILRDGIDAALLGLGRASVADLVTGDVLVPPGFAP
jgi:L-lactate dehydrogenase (cytochrome)/glycolate oxidase